MISRNMILAAAFALTVLPCTVRAETSGKYFLEPEEERAFGDAEICFDLDESLYGKDLVFYFADSDDDPEAIYKIVTDVSDGEAVRVSFPEGTWTLSGVEIDGDIRADYLSSCNSFTVSELGLQDVENVTVSVTYAQVIPAEREVTVSCPDDVRIQFCMSGQADAYYAEGDYDVLQEEEYTFVVQDGDVITVDAGEYSLSEVYAYDIDLSPVSISYPQTLTVSRDGVTNLSFLDGDVSDDGYAYVDAADMREYTYAGESKTILDYDSASEQGATEAETETAQEETGEESSATDNILQILLPALGIGLLATAYFLWKRRKRK